MRSEKREWSARSPLIVEWRSEDPRIAMVLRRIRALPEDSAARFAAEAALHEWWATWLREQAGRRSAS